MGHILHLPDIATFPLAQRQIDRAARRYCSFSMYRPQKAVLEPRRSENSSRGGEEVPVVEAAVVEVEGNAPEGNAPSRAQGWPQRWRIRRDEGIQNGSIDGLFCLVFSSWILSWVVFFYSDLSAA